MLDQEKMRTCIITAGSRETQYLRVPIYTVHNSFFFEIHENAEIKSRSSLVDWQQFRFHFELTLKSLNLLVIITRV